MSSRAILFEGLPGGLACLLLELGVVLHYQGGAVVLSHGQGWLFPGQISCYRSIKTMFRTIERMAVEDGI